MNKSQKRTKSFKSIHFSSVLKFLKKSKLKIAALIMAVISVTSNFLKAETLLKFDVNQSKQ